MTEAATREIPHVENPGTPPPSPPALASREHEADGDANDLPVSSAVTASLDDGGNEHETSSPPDQEDIETGSRGEGVPVAAEVSIPADGSPRGQGSGSGNGGSGNGFSQVVSTWLSATAWLTRARISRMEHTEQEEVLSSLPTPRRDRARTFLRRQSYARRQAERANP